MIKWEQWWNTTMIKYMHKSVMENVTDRKSQRKSQNVWQTETVMETVTDEGVVIWKGWFWKVSPDIHPPPSREWQPSTTGDKVQNGMVLNSMNQTCWGALGCFWWNFATYSRAWRLSQGSQELCLILKPSHLTKYCSFWLTIWPSRISSTIHSSILSTISRSGGHEWWPGTGLSSAGINLMTLKTRCSLLMEGGSQRQYALFPTLLTIGKGPNLWWDSFHKGLVVWMSLVSKYTLFLGW